MLSFSDIPPAWRSILKLDTAKLEALFQFVASERERHAVFPPDDRVFAALEATAPERVRVVLLGQDPYHDHGQAQGLAFSVPPGIPFPPSLRNIFKELACDLGCPIPVSGDLSPWAARGVLLLNPVLTVREHAAGSHRKKGWELFTDAVLQAINDGPQPVVFLLWGAEAKKKRPLIDSARHRVLAGAHPSPLSAYRGFFGSRPYSQTNALLRKLGRDEINWSLS